MRRLLFFVSWHNEVLDFFIAAVTLAGLLRAQASALHHFFRKIWSTSLFLQKKMRCLIISSEKCVAPHYFFRKKWGASLFLKKKIIMLCWRSTEALRLVTSLILLLMLFLKWKKLSATLFLQKQMKCLIFSSEKMRCLFISLEKHVVRRCLFRKKMRCLLISSEKKQVPHYLFKNKSAFLSEEIRRCLIFFWRNNKALDLFLKKEWGPLFS